MMEWLATEKAATEKLWGNWKREDFLFKDKDSMKQSSMQRKELLTLNDCIECKNREKGAL